jgi:hypothetical protein
MTQLNIINKTMTTVQFAELTGTEVRSVHVKTKKLLADLGFEIDDPNLDHEEFQVVRCKRGYILREKNIEQL